jgi:hypothetical protein
LDALKVLLLVLAFFVLHESAAQTRTPLQVRCEDTLQRTPATLVAKANGYTVDNTLPYRTLTRMKDLNPDHDLVMGLTRTEAQVSVGIATQLLSDRKSGYECLIPKLDVVVQYVPIKIYVGKEFRPGSCAYDEILKHEMRHLQIYLDHLPKVEASARAALQQRFGGQPMYAPIGQVKRKLEEEIDSRWMPYLKTAMERVDLQHKALDSPAEYARLSKICQGEVQSIIGPARRKR